MKTLSSDKKIRRLAGDAACLAAALLLSYVEALFPLALLPLPGFRPGLANLAITAAAFRFSPADAAAVSLARILLTFFLFGNPTALLFSLTGGVCVLLLLTVLRLCPLTAYSSYLGVSVLSAFAHNAGQLAAAFVLTGPASFGYLPVLAAASLLYGSLTGILLNLLPETLLPGSARKDPA